MELEGLRGLAAIAVVAWHYLYAFYPALTTGNMGFQHMRFEDNVYGTPLAIIFSGTFAVAIFFVLSGFVLTIGFFQTKRAEIIRKLASKRYLRLMLPALASVLICLLLMKSGLASVSEAAAFTHSKWLGNAWHFDGGILHALYNGVVRIFIDSKSAYNNVLWTMTTEFIGSFMVFGFALFFAQSRHRWIGYFALGVLTFNTWFIAFVIGMAIADAYSAGVLEKIKSKLFIAPVFVLGILFGSYPPNPKGTAYEFMRLGAVDINFTVLYLTLGASLLVLAVIVSRKIANVLKTPRVSILGKYTFSLYLIHLPILYVLTTTVFVHLVSRIGYNKAVIAAVIVTLPVLWIATRLFERYIDSPSIAFAKRVADIYEGKEALDLRRRFAAAKENLQFRWVILQSRVSSVFRPTEDISE